MICIVETARRNRRRNIIYFHLWRRSTMTAFTSLAQLLLVAATWKTDERNKFANFGFFFVRVIFLFVLPREENAIARLICKSSIVTFLITISIKFHIRQISQISKAKNVRISPTKRHVRCPTDVNNIHWSIQPTRSQNCWWNPITNSHVQFYRKSALNE